MTVTTARLTKRHRRWLAAVAWSVFLLVVATVGATADTPAPSYRQAVSDTYDIVRGASPGDVSAAQQATTVLRAGTGQTQPEIIADLALRPPDFKDASLRLQALLSALDNPADTPNPAQAQQRLHDVLAMHRYDDLHRPPSPLDQFLGWIQDRLKDILRALLGQTGPGGAIPPWFIYSIGILIMAGVAFVVFRSTLGRFRGGVAADAPAQPEAPADLFARADRLAAAGDRFGAIRALCAGVAATLAGERSWEGSPLTVREIFQRAPDPASLRPLLLPFEAAVYGGRDVDAATYERAAAVAARYRVPSEKAA